MARSSTLENNLRIVLTATLFAATLAGCATTAPPPSPPPAKTQPFQFAIVNLAPASGTLVSGKLRVIAQADGVYCSAADASSAGGHFNPSGAAHGRAGSGPHHAGDIDNLVANDAGVVRVDAYVRGVTLGGGGPTDIIRRAVIVHANADDYTTQPTGNAGARVACGVIEVDLR
jgi:superoxide dismutase, Cu-Zn family